MRFEGHRQQLQRLVEISRSVDRREFEWLSPSEVIAQVVPQVAKIAAEAVQAFETLSVEVCRLDDALLGRADHDVISGQLFFAQVELNALRAGLGALSDDDSQELVSACARVLGRISSASISLERLLAASDGVPSEMERLSGVPLSLQTRVAYAKFRREVMAGGWMVWPAPRVEVHRRVRLAGTAIAKLMGAEVYGHLRCSDRMELKGLQERILQWLRSGEGRLARDGFALWEDVASFAELLRQVNHRQELHEHDAALARRMVRELASAAETEPIGPARLSLFHALEGRSDEIDALLDEGEHAPVSRWTALMSSIVGHSLGGELVDAAWGGPHEHSVS